MPLCCCSHPPRSTQPALTCAGAHSAMAAGHAALEPGHDGHAGLRGGERIRRAGPAASRGGRSGRQCRLQGSAPEHPPPGTRRIPALHSPRGRVRLAAAPLPHWLESSPVHRGEAEQSVAAPRGRRTDRRGRHGKPRGSPDDKLPLQLLRTLDWTSGRTSSQLEWPRSGVGCQGRWCSPLP